MKTFSFSLFVALTAASFSAFAENHAPKPSTVPPPSTEVCPPADEEGTPFFKKGPRSTVLDSVVTALGTEFNAARARSPKKAKMVVEAETLESAAVRMKLIENRISFQEYAEIVRRWNEKEKRAVEVVPRTKREYRKALRDAFDRADEEERIEREAAKLADRLDKLKRDHEERLTEALKPFQELLKMPQKPKGSGPPHKEP